MTKVCEKCGQTCEDGAQFCPECGEAFGAAADTVCQVCGETIEAGSKFCPHCGAPISAGPDFCQVCGRELAPGSKFCPQCGATVGASQTHLAAQRPSIYSEEEDIRQNKAMAILAYIGILVLIPIFAAKDSPYARYHANQGLVLLLAAVIYSVAYFILSAILMLISLYLSIIVTLLGLVSIAFLVFMILGIVNAATGQKKPLPLIGKITLLH